MTVAILIRLTLASSTHQLPKTTAIALQKLLMSRILSIHNSENVNPNLVNTSAPSPSPAKSPRRKNFHKKQQYQHKQAPTVASVTATPAKDYEFSTSVASNAVAIEAPSQADNYHSFTTEASGTAAIDAISDEVLSSVYYHKGQIKYLFYFLGWKEADCWCRDSCAANSYRTSVCSW